MSRGSRKGAIVEKTGDRTSRRRLDGELVSLGLVETRSRAQAVILAGKVSVDGVRVTKAGHAVKEGQRVELETPDHPYVSRGGLKLEAALQNLDVSFEGLHVLDVGYGQLHWRLRKDPRVTVIERTNIRKLTPDALPEPPQGAVIDVSFISLRVVLPVTLKLLAPNPVVVTLIKPQFELEREAVGKKGVVRDEQARLRAVRSVGDDALELGLKVLGWVPSSIKGPKGNQEYLMAMQSSGAPGTSSRATPATQKR